MLGCGPDGAALCADPPISNHPGMPTEIQYVEANGLRFAYLSEGTGPLVLLLHGFPDTAHSWDAIRPRLASKGYRAVSPFLRGYRPTEIPTRDTDQETLARDVLGLIDALGESRAILIGHDWGAAASYGAVGLSPDRVEKLFVLAIPHPATLRPTLRKLWGVRHVLMNKLGGAPGRFARNDFAALRELYARWSPTWEPSDEELASVRECFGDPESLNAAFGYYRALSFRVPEYAKRPVAIPTVAFAGLDDPMAEPDDYEHARSMFSGPYVVESMRGGHFMHREHPEQFASLLLGHL